MHGNSSGNGQTPKTSWQLSNVDRLLGKHHPCKP